MIYFLYSVNRDHGSMSFRNIDGRKKIYKEIVACFFVPKKNDWGVNLTIIFHKKGDIEPIYGYEFLKPVTVFKPAPVKMKILLK